MSLYHYRTDDNLFVSVRIPQITEFDGTDLLLQVASATSTFSMVFSSSMSVVQYYLLDRFPVPYGTKLQ